MTAAARRRGAGLQKKRASVLDATLEILSEAGSGASISSIAARAGVCRQTVYNRFKSKSKVIAALLVEVSPNLQPPQIPEASMDATSALAVYGEVLLMHILQPRRRQLMRALLRSVRTEMEESLLQDLMALSPVKDSLASFIRAEAHRKAVRVDDPLAEAQLFLDMLTAGAQLRILTGTDFDLDHHTIAGHAEFCARVFMSCVLDPSPSNAIPRKAVSS